MSTRVEGATVCVTVEAHVWLSAGPVHLSLTVRQVGESGAWRYNLGDGTGHCAAGGRLSGVTDYRDALKSAAGKCAAGYDPGTVVRGLLEQFASNG